MNEQTCVYSTLLQDMVACKSNTFGDKIEQALFLLSEYEIDPNTRVSGAGVRAVTIIQL